MAVTIEDGSIVVGADSFVTVAECRAYAVSRGITLPVDDDAVEILLRKAADYLNSLEARYQGCRTDTDTGQPLCFPRDPVYLYGVYVGANTIPESLKTAQCQLAADANGNDLQAPGDGREVLEEQLGPMRTKYAASGTSAPQYYPTAAFSILDPLFKATGSGINLLAAR